jgi:hypothetical protein
MTADPTTPDKMNPRVLPTSSDIWPATATAKACRIPSGGLYVEIPALSESSVLTAMLRSVHQEMQCAGGWAARPDVVVSVEDGMISPQAHSRRFAEGAARLLSIYTALYGAVRPATPFDASPAQLKESAAQSFAYGFHLELQRQQQSEVSYHDEPGKPAATHAQTKRLKLPR